jgi:hypothetical protein
MSDVVDYVDEYSSVVLKLYSNSYCIRPTVEQELSGAIFGE